MPNNPLQDFAETLSNKQISFLLVDVADALTTKAEKTGSSADAAAAFAVISAGHRLATI